MYLHNKSVKAQCVFIGLQFPSRQYENILVAVKQYFHFHGVDGLCHPSYRIVFLNLYSAAHVEITSSAKTPRVEIGFKKGKVMLKEIQAAKLRSTALDEAPRVS